MNNGASQTALKSASVLLRVKAPWMLPAALLGLPFLILCCADPGVFEYRRSAIVEGQWFRLLTSSFVHLNNTHFLLNITAAFLLCLYAFRMPLYLWLWGILLCSLGVGLGLLLFVPQLQYYAGMSGMLHGMTILISIFHLLHNDDRLAWLLLAGLLLKIISESLWGASPTTARWINESVVTEAHLFGAYSGIVASIPLIVTTLQRKILLCRKN